MKSLKKGLLQASYVLLALTMACDNNPSKPGDNDLEVPTTYAFASRFVDGESSVSYSGQTVRNLLVQDIKLLIDNLGKPGADATTASALLTRYATNVEVHQLPIATSVTPGGLHTTYAAISEGKNLAGKISNDALLGTSGGYAGKTSDELIRSWLAVIEQRAGVDSLLGTKDVYTTEEGVDLAQMVNKLLLGAVVYSQATAVYFSESVLFGADNTAQDGGSKPYTKMEHKWDESFGYFGAAKAYFSYSDEDLAGSDFYTDVNGDNAIDFRDEYNFGFSRNAGKRDKGSASGTDFTKAIFDAYLAGRTAIVNQRPRAEIEAQRDIASQNWEKVIAATVVHYINDTAADMEADSANAAMADRRNLNKHWAEMRAFTMALQFNPFKLISDAQLSSLSDMMGDSPVYREDANYSAYLDALKNTALPMLQQVYGFAAADVAAW
jgi:hypothetical protein